VKRIRPLTGKRVVEKLSKVGFVIARKKGSHVIMKNDSGRVVVVPVYAGETIGPGLLGEIIEQAGLTREQFFAIK
jgi:predicted RNA binding protein YcfA (HicA-like mRNA interferase family)